MEQWLSKRLTPAKAKNERLTELFEVVEGMWDKSVEPFSVEIDSARSIFTASDREVDIRLSEMGRAFEVALPAPAGSKALAFVQRRSEIHRKNYEGKLNDILGRDFGGVIIRWLPIYAEKSKPYGTSFHNEVTLKDSDLKPHEIYMTSRGRTLVNLSDAYAKGLTRAQISAAIKRKMDALRPAHIVYDGEFFITIFKFIVEDIIFQDFAPRIARTRNIFDLEVNSIIKAYRFDDIAADEMRLDRAPIQTIQSVRTVAIFNAERLARMPWRLDLGFCVGGQFVSVPGVEGCDVDTFTHPAAFIKTSSRFVTQKPSLSYSAKAKHFADILINYDSLFKNYYFDDIAADADYLDKKAFSNYDKSKTTYKMLAEGLACSPWRLDMGCSIGGQFVSVAGVEGDNVSAFSNLASYSKTATPMIATKPNASFIATPKHFTSILVSQDNLFKKHRFDDVAADGMELDKPPVSEFCSSVTHGYFKPSNLTEFDWSLDRGAVVNGQFVSIAGVEGSKAKTFTHLAATAKTRHGMATKALLIKKASIKHLPTIKLTINKLFKEYYFDDSESDLLPLDAVPPTYSSVESRSVFSASCLPMLISSPRL